jgi:hypothetical protein
MTAGSRQGTIVNACRFSVISMVCGVALLVASAALTDAACDPDLQKLVQFSLQCNAAIGTIEQVSISETKAAGSSLIVRGTYRQKVGKLSFLHLESADTAGGVFEGRYNAATGKFDELQFKISLRAGSVPAPCLR